MQGEAQLHQIVLDHRINALKEYSTVCSKIATDILPKLEDLEGRIFYFEEDHTRNKSLVKKFLLNFTHDYNTLLITDQKIRSELNTHTIIINSLFGTNWKLTPVEYYDPLKKNGENKSVAQMIKEIKDGIIALKKNTVEIINNRLEIMRILSLKIQQ